MTERQVASWTAASSGCTRGYRLAWPRPAASWTFVGELLGQPVGETGDARSIQQLCDGQDDAHIAFDLATQLRGDERVDAEIVQGRLNVQARRRQTELARSVVAQVRLEQPSAFVRVGVEKLVTKAGCRRVAEERPAARMGRSIRRVGVQWL